MIDNVQIHESEYDAILRQAVAVIDRTRAMVATTVCSAIGPAHWEIGKLLHNKKLESKHGSGVVNRLSYDLNWADCVVVRNCREWTRNSQENYS